MHHAHGIIGRRKLRDNMLKPFDEIFQIKGFRFLYQRKDNVNLPSFPNLGPDKIENVDGDVFQLLRKYRDSRKQFDVIVLDPPKFVNSRHQLEQASRGYKDINLLAFKLLKPGGFLFTFSCSGLMPVELFQKIVADSALDAGREARMVRRLGQAEDHPAALNFPEGSYLKGLVCEVS